MRCCVLESSIPKLRLACIILFPCLGYRYPFMSSLWLLTMNSCLVFRPQNPTSLIYRRFTTLTPSSFPHTNTIMYRTPFTSPRHSQGYDNTRLFFRSLASAKWLPPSNLFSSTELSQEFHTLRYMFPYASPTISNRLVVLFAFRRFRFRSCLLCLFPFGLTFLCPGLSSLDTNIEDG